MPPTPETRAMVLAAAAVCEDKKGTEIRILELDPLDSGLSDFFLIASGSNTRQTGAIADDIELKLKREFGTYARSVEGRRKGDWILLDYTDFVVHIFTPETREFYDIERLRKSARPMDAAELAATLQAPAKKAAAAKRVAAATKKAAVKTASAAKKTPATKKSARKTAAKLPTRKAGRASTPATPKTRLRKTSRPDTAES